MGHGDTEQQEREAPAPLLAPAPGPAFKGRYVNGVDAKFRVVVPVPVRAPFIDDGGVLTVWKGRCLAAMPEPEFNRYATHIARQVAASTEDDPDDLLREVWASASDFKLDVQGRLVLSPELRDAVGITDEVRFQGFNRRLELWPAQQSPDAESGRQDRLATIGMLQSSYDLADLGG